MTIVSLVDAFRDVRRGPVLFGADGARRPRPTAVHVQLLGDLLAGVHGGDGFASMPAAAADGIGGAQVWPSVPPRRALDCAVAGPNGRASLPDGAGFP